MRACRDPCNSLLLPEVHKLFMRLKTLSTPAVLGGIILARPQKKKHDRVTSLKSLICLEGFIQILWWWVSSFENVHLPLKLCIFLYDEVLCMHRVCHNSVALKYINPLTAIVAGKILNIFLFIVPKVLKVVWHCLEFEGIKCSQNW